MSEPLNDPRLAAPDAAVAPRLAGDQAGGDRRAGTDGTVDRAATLLLRLEERRRRRSLFAFALAGAGLGLPVAALCWRLALPLRSTAIVGALLAAAAVLAGRLVRRRRRDPLALAAHLDRRLPELGEATALLLAGRPSPDDGALSVSPPLPQLQRLQQRRTAVALLAHDERELARLLPRGPLHRALAALLAGLTVATLVLLAPQPQARMQIPTAAMAPATPRTQPPPAPLLRDLAVTVEPPAYTRHRQRTERTLGVTAEEGATLRWRVDATAPVAAATLLFDESERLALRRLADGSFGATARAHSPRLLRLLLAGRDGRELWRSPPARLEVLADRPPTLELLSPAVLVIERPADRGGTLALAAALADDYGLAAASLVVTLAAGRDEQVTFAERRLPLALRRGAREPGARQVLRQSFDLAALGFAAERELYLRLEVRDGRPQPNVVRSPTIVVRPQGERTESAPLGEGIPMLAEPALFRSQRQIVLDTQKLIGETPRLTAGETMRRSRAIGFDQRALRLRYGTLLGQEFEEGRPAGAEEEGQPGPPQEGIAPLPGGEIAAELGHQHDTARSNTFLPDPVRRKLRAMLAAMWDAEGALATGEPRAALPHELRALALLKEVQQADRVYVRKTAAEGAPLDAARRLTGDREGLRDLTAEATPAPPRPIVEAALAALAEVAAVDEHRQEVGERLRAETVALLAPALAERARDGSAAALAALPALDALRAGRPATPALREALQRALWELVPPSETPVRRRQPGGALWQRYRQQWGDGS